MADKVCAACDIDPMAPHTNDCQLVVCDLGVAGCTIDHYAELED